MLCSLIDRYHTRIAATTAMTLSSINLPPNAVYCYCFIA